MGDVYTRAGSLTAQKHGHSDNFYAGTLCHLRRLTLLSFFPVYNLALTDRESKITRTSNPTQAVSNESSTNLGLLLTPSQLAATNNLNHEQSVRYTKQSEISPQIS